MTRSIDIVILSRQAGELHPDVERGLYEQCEVQLVVHRIIGQRKAADRSRCDAIARARNEGKLCGSSPWLMFLDDDVVLGPRCVAQLAEELERHPGLAALGADYLGERRITRRSRHVSLGATLFRRAALDQIQFVWRGGSCECQCCCDDLRRLRWEIDYSLSAQARHLPVRSTARSPESRHDPATRITCLCVTRRRVALLHKAIRCYANQTYANRELVIVYDSDDAETRRYLQRLDDRSILPVTAPTGRRLTLGALRNLARRQGTGKYVAQWDDDDWSDPFRLEAQMRTVRTTGMPGCVLWRQTLYDYLTKQAYITFERTWENTILVDRSVLSAYPNLTKREDTPVVEGLYRAGCLAKLDAPDLYVYTFHGKNTWDRQHWQEIVRLSRPLAWEASRRIGARLGDAQASEPRTADGYATSTGRHFPECVDPTSPIASGEVRSYALTAGGLRDACRAATRR